VFIDEVDIAQLDAYELAWLRCRKIGYIFQTFNIIQVMTALENVTLPMIFAGVNNDAAVQKGMKLLEQVGLADRHSHKPFELSGGQQQRWRSHGPWRTTRPSSWRTSPPGTSI